MNIKNLTKLHVGKKALHVPRASVEGREITKPNVLFMHKVFVIIISPENANKEPNANIAQSSMLISEINMFMTHNAARIIKPEAFATMLE